MILTRWRRQVFRFIYLTCFFIMLMGWTESAQADLNINILAVNGADETKEKEIRYRLPRELTPDDIIDTAGLKLDYDVNENVYYVEGKVTLPPKGSKTIKVQIRDLWMADSKKIEDIKREIEASFARLEKTEYAETAKKNKENLIKRLNHVITEQDKYADNVEKRMDLHRIYSKEVEKIRLDAMSVSYWRSQQTSFYDGKTVKFIIELENPSETEPQKMQAQHYLPAGIKEEHILDSKGFDVRYDEIKALSYLTKEVELQPAEKKRFEFEVMDIWSILQQDIDNLKERTRKSYKLLENTEYVKSAEYLVAGIKDNLEKIEASQAEEKDIKEHIRAYHGNSQRFDVALKDVEALEDLLDAVRENLERSILKNILQKVKLLKSISNIAKALFKKKMPLSTTWKVIVGILCFIGFMTAFHFIVWSKRSKAIKIEEKQKEGVEDKSKK